VSDVIVAWKVGLTLYADRRPPHPAWMDRSIEKRLYATDAFEDHARLFRPSSDQPPGLDCARVAETMNANDNTSTTPRRDLSSAPKSARLFGSISDPPQRSLYEDLFLNEQLASMSSERKNLWC